MSSRGRGEEQRGEGKGEEQSELGWTKGLCRTTFSTGSCQEPVLKVLEGAQTDNILPPLSLVPVRGEPLAPVRATNRY